MSVKRSPKICKAVLQHLVAPIDRASFNRGLAIPEIINALIEAHPELMLPEEEWNRLEEVKRAAIIENALKTLDTIH